MQPGDARLSLICRGRLVQEAEGDGLMVSTHHLPLRSTPFFSHYLPTNALITQSSSSLFFIFSSSSVLMSVMVMIYPVVRIHPP